MNHTEEYELRYIPEHERASIPIDCFAGPNRSYPVTTQAQVYAAAHLYGKASDPEKVKRGIIRIAKRKGFSLPEGWETGADEPDSDMDDMMKKSVESDMLVFMGGEVKSIGNRRVAGYGVLFTTPKDPDLTEDFFSLKDTDFDIEDNEKRSLYYNHGFDEVIGNHKIGTFTTKKTDMGLWVEGQLKEADEYADAVLSMVEAGRLGYSSGSVGHLVRRERVSKSSNVHKITSWPLGEMSLTNKPAEPRAWAVPLKSWFGEQTEPQIVENSAAPHKAAFSIATIREFEDSLRDAGLSRSQAVALASHGFKGLLRDAGEPENLSDTFRGDALRELARIELQHLRLAGVAL